MTRRLLLPILAALAVLAPAAGAAAATPRIAGTPAVSYTVTRTASGPFVTIGAMVRLTRPFSGRGEQRMYSIVAAPRLRRGQVLDDELFGGSSLGRLARRPGAWYRAEAVQLRRRSSVRPGARWQVALVRGNRIVGSVRTVTLRRS